jgi:stage IV sporulation protein A
MDLLVLPNIQNTYKRERARDELPQSAAGRTIMTTEPKFVPNEAVEITVGENLKLKTRLVDCVGYLVNNALRLHGKRCSKNGKNTLVRGRNTI